jgi:hypothetical protein
MGKYANMQICKCANMQMCKCANMQKEIFEWINVKRLNYKTAKLLNEKEISNTQFSIFNAKINLLTAQSSGLIAHSSKLKA